MIWTAILVVLLTYFALSSLCPALWQFYRKCKALRPIPGWPTHWFWGNLLQYDRTEATRIKLTKFVQDNRLKIFRVWFGPIFPIVCVCHSSSVQEVIKLPKDKYTYSYLRPWLGDGLLISEGKKWFRNRRLLTPAFHYEILKGYVPVVNTCLEVFLDKWTTAAKEDKGVFVFDDVSKLSLDILLRCSFSSETNCQLSDEHPYVSAVPKLALFICERFHTLLHQNEFIYSLTAKGRAFKATCKIAHDYTEAVIRERKEVLKAAQAKGSGDASQQTKYLDFLDILLTAQDEDGKGLTDAEIRDEADTFMFEGHDTTTSGMSWTLYCLAQYPEHQDKIREEVRNVLMGREWLEYEDLKKLEYTTWCIKEAMRLYPPVLDVVRQTTQNTEVAGHVIPPGVMVIIDVLRLHYNPDDWENPDEFNPLRFHPSHAEGRHPYAYIPFSAGYRNCIGQNFALNEERMVIASVVSRFHLAVDESHKVETEQRLIYRAKYDIKLSLK